VQRPRDDVVGEKSASVPSHSGTLSGRRHVAMPPVEINEIKPVPSRGAPIMFRSKRTVLEFLVVLEVLGSRELRTCGTFRTQVGGV
jgi:hypothetical protein